MPVLQPSVPSSAMSQSTSPGFPTTVRKPCTCRQNATGGPPSSGLRQTRSPHSLSPPIPSTLYGRRDRAQPMPATRTGPGGRNRPVARAVTFHRDTAYMRGAMARDARTRATPLWSAGLSGPESLNAGAWAILRCSPRNQRGRPGSNAFERLVTRQWRTAARTCPTLTDTTISRTACITPPPWPCRTSVSDAWSTLPGPAMTPWRRRRSACGRVRASGNGPWSNPVATGSNPGGASRTPARRTSWTSGDHADNACENAPGIQGPDRQRGTITVSACHYADIGIKLTSWWSTAPLQGGNWPPGLR